MTQAVYKYPLDISGYNEISMPIGAEILTVQIQDGKAFVWALVDINPYKNLEVRKIAVYGTGHTIHTDVKYIGTIQMMDGKLVFHVFEELA